MTIFGWLFGGNKRHDVAETALDTLITQNQDDGLEIIRLLRSRERRVLDDFIKESGGNT